MKKADPQLAVILALYKSGTRLLPSGYLLQKKIDSLKLVAKKRKLSPEKINATVEVVDKIVEQVLKYAYDDGFVKLSGLRRFTPQTGDEYWQPTAPGFMSAIEPYWNTLRVFFLIHVHNLPADLPINIVLIPIHRFYKELKEVYTTW